jgi:hypothetical protein
MPAMTAITATAIGITERGMASRIQLRLSVLFRTSSNAMGVTGSNTGSGKTSVLSEGLE